MMVGLIRLNSYVNTENPTVSVARSFTTGVHEEMHRCIRYDKYRTIERRIIHECDRMVI